jgi:hypothetical protein
VHFTVIRRPSRYSPREDLHLSAKTRRRADLDIAIPDSSLTAHPCRLMRTKARSKTMISQCELCPRHLQWDIRRPFQPEGDHTSSTCNWHWNMSVDICLPSHNRSISSLFLRLHFLMNRIFLCSLLASSSPWFTSARSRSNVRQLPNEVCMESWSFNVRRKLDNARPYVFFAALRLSVLQSMASLTSVASSIRNATNSCNPTANHITTTFSSIKVGAHKIQSPRYICVFHLFFSLVGVKNHSTVQTNTLYSEEL